jgi:hypothetical protein
MSFKKTILNRRYDSLDSRARYNGYIKKQEVLDILKDFNFLSKDKLIRKIRRL